MEEQTKILIVEDEVVIAMDLTSTLEKLGYVVSGHITRGEDVISAIEEVRPNLILMDIKLEGEIDGIDAAQIVSEKYDIPVLFITSYSNKNILERSKKTNPFGYIVKPFDDRELYTIIEIAIYKHNTELKLRESEKKYRELSESIQQIVIECDLDGKITYLNQTGMELLYVSPSDLEAGTFLSEFFNNGEFEAIKTRISEYNAVYARKNSGIHKIRNKNNREIIIEEFLSPVYNNNIITGYRGIIVDTTEKHNLIAKVKENEERLVQIASNINDAFWIINKSDSKCYFTNSAFNLMYEAEPKRDSNIREMIESSIHPDDFDEVKEEYRLKADIGEFNKQFRIITPSGKLKWIHEKALPIKNKDGVIKRMAGYAIDITSQKLAESELYQSEKMKENILKSMPDSFIVLDRNCNITNAYIKSDEEVLFSEPDYNLIGRHVTSVFDINYAETIIDKVDRCFATSKMVFYDNEIIKNNTRSWFEIRIAPGNEDSVLVIIRNVTDSKNNLLELQKYYNIINQANEVIIITDRHGLIEYVNPKFTESTGFLPHEVIGENPKVFKSGKHSVDFYRNLWNTILKGNSIKVEFTNKKKDGTFYLEEKVISPIKNIKGEITNFIATGRDITEERRTEKKMRAYQRLEKILEKKEQKYRTLSLIQGQEEERKRMARELHDGLGQMLAVTFANLDNLNLEQIADEEKSKILVAQQMVSEIVHELRRISHNLSPGGLYEFGLYATTKQFIDRINNNYKGIYIQFESNIQGMRFKNDQEINMFRIIQESLQNILKHSKSKKAYLELMYKDGNLFLEIADDGVGFDLKLMNGVEKHFNGIRNIQERAKIIDAGIEFKTAIGQGLKINLNVKAKVI